VKVKVMRKGKLETIQLNVGELKEAEAAIETPSGAKPKLGMALEDITPDIAQRLGLTDTSGVVVVQIEDGSPAAEAGIQPGDVILEVDQKPVKSLQDFNAKTSGYKAGDTLLLLAKRQSATLYLTLKIWE
jgi:serine protease Do